MMLRTIVGFAMVPMLCLSCASSQKTAPQSVYDKYLDACVREDEDVARGYLVKNNVLAPCPATLGNIPKSKKAVYRPVVIVAHNLSGQFVQSDGDMQIDPGMALDPKSIENKLILLKYAIKNEDVSALSDMILSSKRPSLEYLKKWIVSSDAQDIYAAAATNPDTWFHVRGKEAICQISGIVLKFEAELGAWKWDYDFEHE